MRIKLFWAVLMRKFISDITSIDLHKCVLISPINYVLRIIPKTQHYLHHIDFQFITVVKY